jgi:hypothetical protein
MERPEAPHVHLVLVLVVELHVLDAGGKLVDERVDACRREGLGVLA